MEFLCSISQMGEIDCIIQEMNKKKAHYPLWHNMYKTS